MRTNKTRAPLAALPLIVYLLSDHAAALPPTTTDGPRLTDASSWVLPTEMLQGRTMDAELVDLDGDGRLDLIVASEFGQNVVLFQDQSGFSNARNAIPRGRVHDSEDIAAADFDGNGLLDIVFVAEDDQVNELYLQTLERVFIDASERLPTPGGVTNAVLAIDLDNDGDTDLLLGNAGANVALLNDGDAHFELDNTGRIPKETRITQDIESGDLDGDGDTDFVLANEDGVSVWIRNTLGAYEIKTADWVSGLPQIEIREADLGDLDGDGDPDLILANVGWRPGNDPRNRVLMNVEGSFEDVTATTPMSGANTLDGDIVDIDLDGDLDIVWGASQGGPALSVWINDGSGSFTDQTGAWAGALPLTHTIDLEVADVDGDGAMDVYVANHVSVDRVLRGS